jgi:hypothetical protein
VDGPLSPGGWIPDSPQTKAASNKPKSSGTQSTASGATKKLPSEGSKNSGNPVAITRHEQKEAPWMFFCMARSRKFMEEKMRNS